MQCTPATHTAAAAASAQNTHVRYSAAAPAAACCVIPGARRRQPPRTSVVSRGGGRATHFRVAPAHSKFPTFSNRRRFGDRSALGSVPSPSKLYRAVRARTRFSTKIGSITRPNTYTCSQQSLCPRLSIHNNIE